MREQFNPLSLLVLALMGLAAWLAAVAAPTTMLADSHDKITLATIVPESFGVWRIDSAARNVLVEPALQRAIDAVYAQTISRVYVNARGERIMLAIAYGRDQSDNFQVHLPEGCYQGQGFAVNQSEAVRISTRFGAIPAQRMVAERLARREAVTYWLIIGDRFGTDEWERKKSKLSYALKRTVPDGMLVRVSSITPDTQAAFDLQQQFIQAMLDGVPMGRRRFLFGGQAL